ncbi:MAG: hypothetical protein ACR2QK_06340 [Acidimicrobiales bacterium]
MTDIEPEEDQTPVAHVTLVYNGPVAPHWEMKVRYGDQKMLDDFWTRVNARLLLLPKHDPQFRRNRERVNRDAERELIICDWDLGEDDAESTSTPSAVAPPVEAAPVQAEAAEPAPAEVQPEAEAAEAPVEAEAAEAAPAEVEPEAEAAPARAEAAEVAPEDGAGAEPAADVVDEATEQPAGQA